MYDSEFDQAQFDRDIESRGRSRSRSFIADDEVEEEPKQYSRGRTRSRSFTASSVTSDEELTPGSSSRRRSRSFVSDNGSEEDEQEKTQMDSIARAASLSKIYLAGGTPVDPNNLPPPKHGKRKSGKNKTGAVTGSALNALSAGLQTSARIESRNMTEEELEERKMAEEEAQKLKDEKESIKKPTAQSRAMALASKAANFKTQLFSRKLGTRSSSKDVSDGSLTGTASTSRDSTKSDAPSQPPKKHKLKLLLLGDSGVGKTSLLRVLSGDPFSESMLATAGVDFKLRNIVVEDRDVALQIWDTAGQERFHRITATYYKGANGIILVYDVNDPKGFENVGYWMNNIQQYSSPNLPAMLLVGNKIDLPNRAVTADEGQSAANQYHCRFLETSAKTSENVEDALITIATDALFLSLHAGMTQKELLEKEKLYGVRGLRKENCVLS